MTVISPFPCSKAQSHFFCVTAFLLPDPVQDPVRKWRIQLWHQRVESVCLRPGQGKVRVQRPPPPPFRTPALSLALDMAHHLQPA